MKNHYDLIGRLLMLMVHAYWYVGMDYFRIHHWRDCDLVKPCPVWVK